MSGDYRIGLAIVVAALLCAAPKGVIAQPTDPPRLRATPLTVKDQVQFGTGKVWGRC